MTTFRMCGIVVAVALTLIGALSSPVTARSRYREDEGSPSKESCDDLTAFWPLWSALAGYPGGRRLAPALPASIRRADDHHMIISPPPRDEDEPTSFFPQTEILAALRSVPLTQPLPAHFGLGAEHYQPESWDDDFWQQTMPYAQAAAFYEAEDFAKAIPLFDAIAAVEGAPQHRNLYRAAAAYSAARAAFRLGNFEDGVTRIARILANNDLQEFWAASWTLIPRMRAGTEAWPLAAAEAAEIAGLLVSPTTLVCGDDRQGQTIMMAAREDFGISASRSKSFDSTIRQPQDSPVTQALTEMPEYYDFDSGGKDWFWAADMAQPHQARWPESWAINRDADTARSQWRQTHNPLWALALGKAGAIEDLPALTEAIAVVRTYPDMRNKTELAKGISFSTGWYYLTDRARATLVWALSAYRARMLVMAGRQAEALQALTVPTPEERQEIAENPPEMVTQAWDSLVNGGISYLLARGDLSGARAWGIAASTALKWPVADILKPLLVTDIGELYFHPVFHLAPVNDVVELGPWRALLDTWPSARLIELSRRPEVSPGDRRAMVGAAWIRAFALRRWKDVFAWLPDLRRAYPPLAPDIDMIERAWLPVTKRHLALRLALRAPGLVALPSWSRPPNAPRNAGLFNIGKRSVDVLAIDDDNPSDGNWWCAAQPEKIRGDARAFLLAPLAGDINMLHRNQPAASLKAETGDSPADRLAATLPLGSIDDGGELDRLAEAGSSTQRLAEDTLKWARGSRGPIQRWLGTDDSLPEALHLVVRATHIGCRRPATTAQWSKTAFQILHRRFPNSEWTRQTPYWYEDQ